MNTIIKDLKELEGKTIESVDHDQDNTFTIRTTDGIDYDVVATGNEDLSGVFATLSFERLGGRVDWTPKDNSKAISEGWVISNDAKGQPSIQWYDGDDDERFKSDVQVWEMLKQSDEFFHKKALVYISETNPDEYKRITEYKRRELTEDDKKYIHGMVDTIYEGELFWEDKSKNIDKLRTDEVKENVVAYAQEYEFSPSKDEGDHIIIYDYAVEQLECNYNRVKANFIEKVEYELSNILHDTFDEVNGENYLPDNFPEVVKYCAEVLLDGGTIEFWYDRHDNDKIAKRIRKNDLASALIEFIGSK